MQSLATRSLPNHMASISTSGLPNLGYKAYIVLAERMKREFPGKPVIASVAGLALDEFPGLVQAFQNSDADLIEVNLHSCPKEKDKQQLAHDVQATESVLKSIMKLGKKPVGVKLPMFSDSDHIERNGGGFHQVFSSICFHSQFCQPRFGYRCGN